MRRRGCPCSQNLWMWIEGAGRSGVQARDELGHRVAFLSVLEPALEEAGRSGVQACDELGHRNAVLSVLVQICT